MKRSLLVLFAILLMAIPLAAQSVPDIAFDSNGDLLRGVRFLGDSARTHSLVMCTRCNWVRFVDGIHFFARERREEVRLLGY